MPVDENELNDLIGRFITDLGATVHAGNVERRINRRPPGSPGPPATETPFNIIYEVRP